MGAELEPELESEASSDLVRINTTEAEMEALLLFKWQKATMFLVLNLG